MFIIEKLFIYIEPINFKIIIIIIIIIKFKGPIH